MAPETLQTESDTTQQPLYRVRARHVLLSSDPPEESEPLPIPRYEQPRIETQTQLNHGAVSFPGPHAFTSSLPESMSLMRPGAAPALAGPAKLAELAGGEETSREREEEGGSSSPSQLFQPHAMWRTSHTPPPPSSLPSTRTDGIAGDDGGEEEVDELRSSSLPGLATEVADDAPEIPDPVDPPRDSAPFVESPPESNSPQPFRATRKSARNTPKKATDVPALTTDGSPRLPISTFSPSPMKGKSPYIRQTSVPATAAQHRSPFSKTSRVFGRTRSDRAPIIEEDVPQDSFTNDQFLNPRQRLEKLERESRRPTRSRAATTASARSSDSNSGPDEVAEATATEEQHDSHFVSQSLKHISATEDVEEEDIDAAFAEMDKLQPTYKGSPTIETSNERSSESPTPQWPVAKPSAHDESLEESSHRDLFAESTGQPTTRLQRFDMPSSAESSGLNPLSQLATTSEKGFGVGEDSQIERTFPATQFVARSPSKEPSSPSKYAAGSPTKSDGVDPTQITTSPAAVLAEMQAIPQASEISPATNSHIPATANGMTGVLPSIPASRQLTRSRPNSVATAQSNQNGSRTSISADHARDTSPVGSTGTTGANGSSGAPSSRLTASRMLRRKSDRALDPDAALYSPKERTSKSATPGHAGKGKPALTNVIDPVEATQLDTQVDEMPTGNLAPSLVGDTSSGPTTSAQRPPKRGSTTRTAEQHETPSVNGGIMTDDLSIDLSNPNASLPLAPGGFEPTLIDDAGHGSVAAPENVSQHVVLREPGEAAAAAFPLIDRLRAPLRPEASSLLTPLPSSSPSRPSRDRVSSPALGPTFRAAQLESSPPRDSHAAGDNASDDPASRPSDKNRTLEVPPNKSPPKRLYGKRPARERKQTARAKEGQEQERTRKAKKAELPRLSSPAMRDGMTGGTAHAADAGAVADIGKGRPPAEGNAIMSGDESEASSATTVSDPEDETFCMTQVQIGGRKQKRNRSSSDREGSPGDSDGDQREGETTKDDGRHRSRNSKVKETSSTKQRVTAKGKEVARSKRSTPSRPASSTRTRNIDDEDDGYVSPETPVDTEDYTFRPNANGKRKRGASEQSAALNLVAGTSTRGPSTAVERASKRRRQGRPSRDAADSRQDDAIAGLTTPSRSAGTKLKAQSNGSAAAPASGRIAGIAGHSSTPVPAGRHVTAASTTLSSFPLGPQAGMRVLAHWASGQWFVGTTTDQMSGNKITIDFDDKTRDKVSASQIRRFELRQGDQVGSIRPPRESGVVEENYIDDGRSVPIVGANGKRKKVPIAAIFVTSANISKHWDDRRPNFDALGLPSPPAPTASRSESARPRKPFESMRFLTTIDEDARKNTTKDDLKSAINAGGGHVVEDWRELFELPDGGFGSAWAEGGPVFCIVHGAQSTKPKALIALAAGIPCVASEWVHDASTERDVDWRSYLVCAGSSETLDRDVSQVIDPKYGMEHWQAGQARNCRQPFNAMKVLFVTPKDTDFEPVKRLVPVCLHALGASLVKQVPNASANEDLTSYDYVLVESRDAAFKKSKLPKAWQTCEKLVNTGWLKQCIIMGTALPASGLD